jgi:gamma-butyrobetaine dioxygenase
VTVAAEGFRAAALAGEVVEVVLSDGRRLSVHAHAVRDACSCAACRLPSGQRLFESHVLLPATRARSAAIDDGTLVIAFADGHATRLRPCDVRALAEPPSEPEAALWGAELTHDLSRHTLEHVEADAGARRAFLADVERFGVAIVVDAPCRHGAVAEVAELFSPVRTTNYGRVFDVRVRVDAANLADSALPLSVHTDNVYRAPQPTIQLLQCLETSATGGETVLVDGFRAIERLRLTHPSSLDLLATQRVRYAYDDRTAALEATVTVVELGDDGAPVALHVNNRSKTVPRGAAGRVGRWYESYFRLWELLDRPEAQARIRLEPGSVVVMDNWRVLHGRTAFTAAGGRWLQGCYADRDALLSTLRVLQRASGES